MLRHRVPLALTGIFSVCISFTASAEAQVFDRDYLEDKSPVTIEGGIGMYSDRTFRGQNLYDGLSIQPNGKVAVQAGPGSFYAKTLMHFSADGDVKGGRAFRVERPEEPTDGDGGEEGDLDTGEQTTDEDTTIRTAPVTRAFNEFDFSTGYEFNFDTFLIDVGHTWYFYSRSRSLTADTREVYATFDINMPAHPYITAAYDWDAREGWYYELGVREEIPLGLPTMEASLIPFARLGFSNGLNEGDNPRYDSNGIAYIDVGVNSMFHLSEQLKLQPELKYIEGIDDFTDSELTFGMNVVGTFAQ